MPPARVFISYSPHEWLEFDNPKQKYAALVERLREQGINIVNPKLELDKYTGLSRGKLNKKITLELKGKVDMIYNYMPSYQQRYAYVHRRVARELGIPVYKEKKVSEKSFSITDAAYRDWVKSNGEVPISTLTKKYLLPKLKLLTAILKRYKQSEIDNIYKYADDKAFAQARGIIVSTRKTNKPKPPQRE